MTFFDYVYMVLPVGMAKEICRVINNNQLDKCSLAEKEFVIELWLDFLEYIENKYYQSLS